jgi:signal transduction histidine kinase/CheY-like chemotaxis protein
MTLGKQLNRAVAALFVLAMVCFALVIYLQQQKRLERMTDKVSVFLASIAKGNSLSLANEIFEQRIPAIEMRLANLVTIRGIERAEVYDTEGKRLAGAGKPFPLDAQAPPFSSETTSLLSGELLVFSMPVVAYGESFGLLVLIYPFTDILREEWRGFFQTTIGCLFFMLLMLLLISVLTHSSVTSPLKNLIAVMSKVRQGRLGQVIESEGSDEIRELSQTFSQMTEDLAKGYQELKETTLFAEQLLDTIDSILFAVDASLKVTALNTAAATYVGAAKDEVLDKPLFQILPVLAPLSSLIIQAMGNQRPEFLYRQSLAGVFYNISIAPLRKKTEGGALVRLDDITRQEEQESQLRQAQKMETVGMIAGGVAHDFNNMLTGILGAAELLSLRIDDPATRQYVSMITQTGKRASDLTAKLLAFGRKTTIEIEPVDIHQVIDAAVALLSRSINKAVSIVIELSAEKRTLEGDFTELQNCLLNLGINAAHAMPGGGVITIATREIDLLPEHPVSMAFNLPQGAYIELEVRDTGEGIAPEHLGAIFEPFFTTKERGRGTGLGLAAVYGSVKQMKGGITVTSVPGAGTSFRLFFPLSSRESNKAEVKPPVRTPGQGWILVVDDEEIVRDTAREMLKFLGYKVDLAANGKVAVAAVAANPARYDLVLLDMIMPEMDGTSCFAALRRISPELKIILSSGFTQDADLERLKGEGLAGFLRKPYDYEELSRMVTTTIG